MVCRRARRSSSEVSSEVFPRHAQSPVTCGVSNVHVEAKIEEGSSEEEL